MKRLLCKLTVLIVIAVATIMSPHAAHATPQWETVTFEGVVTRPNGTPVPNLMVVVNCINTPSSFTDVNGHYVIEGSGHLCLGDSITVSTHIRFSPNLTANDAATLLDETTTTTTSPNHINIANIRMGLRTIPVQEYGWIGVLVATSGSIGIMAYTRYLYRRAASRSV
jgi:hypothetical protein